jgi:hypothetical protein
VTIQSALQSSVWLTVERPFDVAQDRLRVQESKGLDQEILRTLQRCNTMFEGFRSLRKFSKWSIVRDTSFYKRHSHHEVIHELTLVYRT